MANVENELVALLTLAALVETRSFTQAAARLGISKSAVSRRVAELERRVGVRLVKRTSRHVSLTEAGLTVAAHATRLAADAKEALGVAEEQASGLAGVVRVAVPVGLPSSVLAGPSARFVAANPGTSVELLESDATADLLADRVDLALRVMQPRDTGAVVRRLGLVRLVVVGAPGYLATRGRPERLGDLLSHDCLGYTRLRPEEEWSFRAGGRSVSVPVRPRLGANSGTVLRELALVGAGLAVLPRFLVEAELAAGRLEAVLQSFAPEPLWLVAMHVSERRPPRRVKAFVEALVPAFAGPGWR